MHKRVALVLGAILILSTLTVSGWVSAAKTRLVITGWGGLYEEAFREQVVKPFQAKYNCDIELVNPGSSTQILARLRAERRSPTIDLVQIGGGLEAVCAAEGLVENVDYTKLSNWRDLLRDATRYPAFGPGGSLSATGLLYHTGRMPFTPTSWYDLWDPRLAGEGKVGVHNIDGNFGLALMTIINELEGGSRSNLNPGFAKFASLMKTHNPLIALGSDSPTTDIVQRGAYMTVCPQSRAIELMRTGYPVKFVYPKEGAFSWPTSIGIVKGTKNLELAKEFINFFISPEINAKWAMHVNYTPVNAKANISRYDHADALMPKAIYGLDWEWINAQRAAWIERWNMEVLSLSR